MVIMNVYFVHVAQLRAPVIGGMEINTLGPAVLLQAYRWINDSQ